MTLLKLPIVQSETVTQKSYPVRRANETIGIKPLSGKMTLLSRRLFHMLILFIQEDGNKEVYRRPLNNFVSNIEFGSKDTTLLKETLRSLMRVNVEWNSDIRDPNNEEAWNNETHSNLVAEVAVIEKGQGKTVFVEWSFPPKLRGKLLDPKFYTLFNHHYFNLKSSASVALFEIIERYKTNPNGRTNRESWDWWVGRLTGSSIDKWEYKYFKRDVICPAIIEINNLATSYEIELIELRENGGRKITSIQFQIVMRKQQQLPMAVPTRINTALIDKLVDMGVSMDDANKIFSNYLEDQILKAIDYTNNRVGKKNLTPITSVPAFLKSAITNGYADAAELASQSTKKVNAAKQAEVKKLKEPTLKEKYATASLGRVTAYFNELPLQSQESFLTNYFNTNKNSTILNAYKKNGLKSTVFNKSFFGWLATHIWGEPTLSDLEEFETTQI
jgi:hypothetical protein